MAGSSRGSTVLMLAAFALLGTGCGGSKSTPTDPSLVAAQRLQGDWQLLNFNPALALEEPLKGLLDAQLKTLVIAFANGEFSATGPSVNSSGRYEISSAEGDSLTGKLYDRSGAGYGVAGQFVGQQFRFVSQDPPWAGNGLLERPK